MRSASAPSRLHQEIRRKRRQEAARASALPLLFGTSIWLLLSSIPGDVAPLFAALKPWNAPAHFVGYLALSLLLYRFLQFHAPGDVKQSAIMTITISLIFALLDEIHQIPIPSRDFDWRDILVDLSGIIAATVLILTLFRGPRSLVLR